MITVLRLGHRRGRDDRISTHVGLTARQWGADRIVYSGEKDTGILDSQRDIIDRWGGDTEVEYTENWKNVIRDFEGLSVHLTMYGEKINERIEGLKKEFAEEEDLLIVVGAEKVPRWVYTHVDYNISVGNQPHSEIAALAVFMDRIQEGRLKEGFEGAEIEVEPTEDRKITRELDEE
ncbi:tRNA (cytidine(56)-2'-O)-methyltransferase [Candidatus Nanohalovita haloferacivicina]|uniref:tRNA (cytidine(56)-2'-O)-methyltransferase n=1 Tax=Candidatus Nanohalovita haloferacivicina TaxID=2978046 RepID=UPI00325FD6F7|nr:tRNA (cytidine56-2'-O)-methyltransferase [Candidatus Nanohalobia archaeon BNXNv]